MSARPDARALRRALTRLRDLRDDAPARDVTVTVWSDGALEDVRISAFALDAAGIDAAVMTGPVVRCDMARRVLDAARAAEEARADLDLLIMGGRT